MCFLLLYFICLIIVRHTKECLICVSVYARYTFYHIIVIGNGERVPTYSIFLRFESEFSIARYNLYSYVIR